MQVVHGLSIPLVKAGINLPRTISSAISNATAPEPEPIPIADIDHTRSTATPSADPSTGRERRRDQAQPRVFQIGRSIIRPKSSASQPQLGTGIAEEPERPVNLVTHEGEPAAGASKTIPNLSSD